MLDGLVHRLLDAAEQQLALEEGAIELASSDRLLSRRR
jgi:hypothetical protein